MTLPVSPRRSGLGAVRASFVGQEQEEETEWKIGGRYKVRNKTPVWHDEVLSGKSVGDLEPKEEVLLLTVQWNSSTQAALIVRTPPAQSGWIALEDGFAGQPPLVRRRLEGSWDMKARYHVASTATLREDASLSSAKVGDVQPEDEVLVLELGLDRGADGREARLRALVKATSTGKVGWLSPETMSGDRLLDPVNLLGPEVVEIHRKSLAVMSPTGKRRTTVTQGPRRSCRHDQPVPWEVGCQYRVLEKLIVRERPDFSSKELGKVPAGALVTVTDIHHAECAHLGLCPCAFVMVDDGADDVQKGWVRCAAKDGHDLIDTRDQLEAEKILNRLRKSQQDEQQAANMSQASEDTGGSEEGSRPQASDEETASDQAQSRRCASSSDSEAGEVKAPKAVGAKKAPAHSPLGMAAEKLESLEECPEDRPIADGGALEEKSYACGCDCGARRSRG